MSQTIQANSLVTLHYRISLPSGQPLISTFNATPATLQLGAGDDADGIMAAKAIGDEGVPLTFGKANFDGALCDAKNPPHFDKGTVITWLLDFDGAGGTAAADVTILFSFLEG